ncbi:hypothetical protein BAE44_0004899 [Dichanthelium oligosanthes]|uniref:Uncharacterized protein n=1 Tax=Dichanthelium oligosanthes TaxID=888268 RepID=A0A1E5WA21_9POAL|nr:hypothetical protein BAE44_0004899 [Dichanthelium oligosanthes]
MSSRHRRQLSRALPLDFDVAVDDEGPAVPKGATSIEGNPGTGSSGGGRGDAVGGAGKGQEGYSKKPPPATGGRSSAEGAGKKSRDDGTGGR